MHLKVKLISTVGILTGLVGNALAEGEYTVVRGTTKNASATQSPGTTQTIHNATSSLSLTPDTNRGMENLATLPYIDKLQWILDTVYALVPYVAILALGFLAVKYYVGGWDSVENEIRTRKAFFAIIIVVLLLKVGSAMVRLISEW